ncbi:hypothetical protein KIPB_004360 [Kipferlia bialata]|uniref:BEACH domain-containing protein n=1 Tax=Kipferlia bialata TaxID=797122 RepID=A0A9K3GI46_9EUKA|nr:hypothetical protein KIPB_004360 [Kipferlia bialata]|eukprot:g4360.t1
MQLPDWTQTPAQFVRWHRECLESPEVSAKLHLWIDMIFGTGIDTDSVSGGFTSTAAADRQNYPLRDNAIKSKGISPLFTAAHPRRLVYPTSRPYHTPTRDMGMGHTDIGSGSGASPGTRGVAGGPGLSASVMACKGLTSPGKLSFPIPPHHSYADQGPLSKALSLPPAVVDTERARQRQAAGPVIGTRDHDMVSGFVRDFNDDAYLSLWQSVVSRTQDEREQGRNNMLFAKDRICAARMILKLVQNRFYATPSDLDRMRREGHWSLPLLDVLTDEAALLSNEPLTFTPLPHTATSVSDITSITCDPPTPVARDPPSTLVSPACRAIHTLPTWVQPMLEVCAALETSSTALSVSSSSLSYSPADPLFRLGAAKLAHTDQGKEGEGLGVLETALFFEDAFCGSAGIGQIHQDKGRGSGREGAQGGSRPTTLKECLGQVVSALTCGTLSARTVLCVLSRPYRGALYSYPVRQALRLYTATYRWVSAIGSAQLARQFLDGTSGIVRRDLQVSCLLLQQATPALSTSSAQNGVTLQTICSAISEEHRRLVSQRDITSRTGALGHVAQTLGRDVTALVKVISHLQTLTRSGREKERERERERARGFSSTSQSRSVLSRDVRDSGETEKDTAIPSLRRVTGVEFTFGIYLGRLCVTHILSLYYGALQRIRLSLLACHVLVPEDAPPHPAPLTSLSDIASVDALMALEVHISTSISVVTPRCVLYTFLLPLLKALLCVPRWIAEYLQLDVGAAIAANTNTSQGPTTPRRGHRERERERERPPSMTLGQAVPTEYAVCLCDTMVRLIVRCLPVVGQGYVNSVVMPLVTASLTTRVNDAIKTCHVLQQMRQVSRFGDEQDTMSVGTTPITANVFNQSTVRGYPMSPDRQGEGPNTQGQKGVSSPLSFSLSTRIDPSRRKEHQRERESESSEVSFDNMHSDDDSYSEHPFGNNLTQNRFGSFRSQPTKASPMSVLDSASHAQQGDATHTSMQERQSLAQAQRDRERERERERDLESLDFTPEQGRRSMHKRTHSLQEINRAVDYPDSSPSSSSSSVSNDDRDRDRAMGGQDGSLSDTDSLPHEMALGREMGRESPFSPARVRERDSGKMPSVLHRERERERDKRSMGPRNYFLTSPSHSPMGKGPSIVLPDEASADSFAFSLDDRSGPIPTMHHGVDDGTRRELAVQRALVCVMAVYSLTELVARLAQCVSDGEREREKRERETLSAPSPPETVSADPPSTAHPLVCPTSVFMACLDPIFSVSQLAGGSRGAETGTPEVQDEKVGSLLAVLLCDPPLYAPQLGYRQLRSVLACVTGNPVREGERPEDRRGSVHHSPVQALREREREREKERERDRLMAQASLVPASFMGPFGSGPHVSPHPQTTLPQRAHTVQVQGACTTLAEYVALSKGTVQRLTLLCPPSLKAVCVDVNALFAPCLHPRVNASMDQYPSVSGVTLTQGMPRGSIYPSALQGQSQSDPVRRSTVMHPPRVASQITPCRSCPTDIPWHLGREDSSLRVGLALGSSPGQDEAQFAASMVGVFGKYFGDESGGTFNGWGVTGTLVDTVDPEQREGGREGDADSEGEAHSPIDRDAGQDRLSGSGSGSSFMRRMSVGAGAAGYGEQLPRGAEAEAEAEGDGYAMATHQACFALEARPAAYPDGTMLAIMPDAPSPVRVFNVYPSAQSVPSPLPTAINGSPGMSPYVGHQPRREREGVARGRETAPEAVTFHGKGDREGLPFTGLWKPTCGAFAADGHSVVVGTCSSLVHHDYRTGRHIGTFRTTAPARPCSESTVMRLISSRSIIHGQNTLSSLGHTMSVSQAVGGKISASALLPSIAEPVPPRGRGGKKDKKDSKEKEREKERERVAREAQDGIQHLMPSVHGAVKDLSPVASVCPIPSLGSAVVAAGYANGTVALYDLRTSDRHSLQVSLGKRRDWVTHLCAEGYGTTGTMGPGLVASCGDAVSHLDLRTGSLLDSHTCSGMVTSIGWGAMGVYASTLSTVKQGMATSAQVASLSLITSPSLSRSPILTSLLRERQVQPTSALGGGGTVSTTFNRPLPDPGIAVLQPDAATVYVAFRRGYAIGNALTAVSSVLSGQGERERTGGEVYGRQFKAPASSPGGWLEHLVHNSHVTQATLLPGSNVLVTAWSDGLVRIVQ